MATWNWPWRRTMRERGLLIGLTASLRSERLGTTCRRYRMHISSQDRVVLRARFRIHAQSTEKSTPTAASSSRTINDKLMELAAWRQAGREIAQRSGK